MFAEVGAPDAAVGSGQFHIHIVGVPPDVHRNDGDTEVNPSTAVGMLVAVFDIVKSHERIKAQQDGMAHVRVAVVHHFHTGRRVRRNQCAGGAPIPLQGGGRILSVPLRGGVPHVGPQVELVPGTDRAVLLSWAAVL